jgi:hypothetical protein
LLFGEQNNLSRVMREVFHGVKDRFEPINPKPLNGQRPPEVALRKPFDNAAGLQDHLMQPSLELARGYRPALGELLVADSSVRSAAQGGDDPLAKVSVEMENQIAHAVRSGVGPPPDLAPFEQGKATLDARQVHFPKQVDGLRQKLLREFRL